MDFIGKQVAKRSGKHQRGKVMDVEGDKLCILFEGENSIRKFITSISFAGQSSYLLCDEIQEYVNRTILNDWKREYNIEYLKHYTDIKNVGSILQNGYLYCRNLSNDIRIVDSASQSVLNCTDNNIKNYVRLYYKEQTPALYNMEGIFPYKRDEKIDPHHMPIPVLLLVDCELMMHSKVRFTDGGGGNRMSSITDDLCEALKFDWEHICKRGEIRSKGLEKKRNINHRNAEFWYPEKIGIEYIKAIVFRTGAEYDLAVNTIGWDSRYRIDISYFNDDNKRNFVEKFSVKRIGNVIDIRVEFYNDKIEPFSHKLKVIVVDDKEYEFDRRSSSIYGDKELSYKISQNDINENKLSDVISVEYYLDEHKCAMWKK